MKLTHSFYLTLVIAALPLAARATTPDASAPQQDDPTSKLCSITPDNKTIACLGGSPEARTTAREWLEDRVESLRDQPEPSDSDQALLRQYESTLSSGPVIVTVKPFL
jgi:hypothetical protein